MVIAAAVGPSRPNRRVDVRTVQQLLNRSGSAGVLEEDGLFGPLTAAAITRYQAGVLRLHRPDGVVDPGGPTLRTLGLQHRPSATPGRPVARSASTSRPVPRPSPRPDVAPAVRPVRATPPPVSPTRGALGPGGLSEDTFISVAAALGVEIASVKAVVATEALRGAFDKQGRPTILFERHKFFRHTGGRFAKSDPDICNATAGGYGGFAAQYPKIERAIKLDREAALKSASWGAFQILGENHRQAGHSTVDAFVAAMKSGTAAQAAAFLKFVQNDPVLLAALRKRNWATFARIYNGPKYRENNYDGKMRSNYQRYANQ